MHVEFSDILVGHFLTRAPSIHKPDSNAKVELNNYQLHLATLVKCKTWTNKKNLFSLYRKLSETK
jgi:hypothetical protein